jgi:hypothetical protein
MKSTTQNRAMPIIRFTPLVLVLILCSIALYGTFDAGWWNKAVWISSASRNTFLGFCAAIILLFFSLLKFRTNIPTLFLIPATLYIGMTGFAPLVSVLWMWLCALSIGAYLSKALGFSTTTLLSFRSAALGFAVIGTLVGLFAHLPINTPSFYLIVFTLIASFTGRNYFSIEVLKEVKETFSNRLKFTSTECFLFAILILEIFLIFYATLLPELGYDALATHLNIPIKMLETSIWKFDHQEYIWSLMPLGGNWLYTPPYFLAGEQGSKLLNSSFLIASATVSHQILAPRVGNKLALLAPVCLMSLPICYLEIGSTFVEMPLAFFFLMSLNELIGYPKNKIGNWSALAVFAGYACAIKLLGVLIVPFLFIGALIRSFQGTFEKIESKTIFLKGIFVFISFGSMPYLVSLIKTGNPVFPFFNSIFKSPFFIVGSMFGNGSDFDNPFYKKPLDFNTFWDMSINSVSFGEFSSSGALGISLLVLLPFAIFTSLKYKKFWYFAMLLSAIAYIIIVFQSQAYLRYAYPVIPWIIIVGVWALSTIVFATIFAPAIVSFLVLINLLRFPVAFWPLQNFNIKFFFDRSESISFLKAAKPEVIMGRLISQMTEFKNKKIILIGIDPVNSAYPSGTLSDSWHSWGYYAPSLKDAKLKTSIARSGAELIVHTVGRGYPGEAHIMEMTNERFRLGDIRVGEIKPESFYTHELISQTSLHPHENSSWIIDRAQQQKNGISVQSNSKISTIIQIKPVNYNGLEPNLVRVIKMIEPTRVNINPLMLEVTVECISQQSFRSEIYWFDKHSKIISHDIFSYPCSREITTSKRKVIVPSGATEASINISSADQNSVLIKSVSLKSTE